MSYCTQQDLIDRFGEAELIELTDEHGTEEIDATKLARAIADADGIIDGHLAGRYTLPLAEVPKVLNRYACDLVRYDLYDHPTDKVKDANDKAMRYLEKAASGAVSLGINTDGSQPQTSNGAQVSSGGNVFSRSDKGFI